MYIIGGNNMLMVSYLTCVASEARKNDESRVVGATSRSTRITPDLRTTVALHDEEDEKTTKD